jgi:tetratricopeptide (TPR) repeat protein
MTNPRWTGDFIGRRSLPTHLALRREPAWGRFRALRELGAGIVLAWMMLSCATAEDIPAEDRPLLDAVHAGVWGDKSWDSPVATREKAILVFDEALGAVQSDAAKAAVWELRADYFRIIGDRVESMRASRVIYESFPESIRSRNAANELVDGARHLKDHAGLLQTALEQIGKTSDPSRIIELTGAVADALVKLGNADAAQAELTALLSRMPEHSEAILMLLHNLGADAIGNGDYVLSQNALLKVYSLMPPGRRNEQLLANVATICVLTGKREDAVRYHLEALERFPNDPRRVSHEFSLGVLLFDLEDLERARGFFQAVVDSKAKVDGIEKLRDASRGSLREIDARLKPKGVHLVANVRNRGALAWLFLLNGGVLVAVAGVVWWRFKKQ